MPPRRMKRDDEEKFVFLALQIHCTSQDFQETVSFCSTTKDCGFSKLPDYLNGVLDCDIKK
ncbi:hypothetical protein NFI96_024775, partial [Prochilodus magdalenae]